MKKITLAVFFGFLFLGFSSVDFAQAIGEPIPGIDIVVKKNPGGIAVTVTTGADGSYSLTGLEAGNYDVTITGQPTKSITIGTNGTLSGVAVQGGPVDITSQGDEVGIAAEGGPISDTPIGLEGEPGLAGEPIEGVDVNLGHNNGSLAITSSDLGITSVGTLPTSYFYFFKEWGRGIDRLFTWRAVSKAKLELKITNEKAAEILEVEKADSNDTEALKNALENYTEAQERLNGRIGILLDSTNPLAAKILEDVDEKTAKHMALLEQLTEKHLGQPQFEDIKNTVDIALNNNLKTFIIWAANSGNDISLKLKAEEQIGFAGVVIEEANSALLQVSTTRGMWQPATDENDNQNVTVPKQTQNPTFGEKTKTGGSDNGESNIFDRWGNLIAKAESNLEEAKKAFAEGKYGEAYGLARSAEAMINGIGITVDVVSPMGGDTTKQKEENKPTSPESKSINDESTRQGVDEVTQPKSTEQREEPKPTPNNFNAETPLGITPLNPQLEETKRVELESTLTKLTANVNPSTFGQLVTFTAIITGGATPTGSVTFLLNNVTNLGSSELNESGVATITTSTLSIGTHTVTATYIGNATYGSSKDSLSFTVGDAPTSAGGAAY